MCRVPLALVVLEHLHLLLVGLGDARELLDSLVDALQKRVSCGRHEVGSAGRAGARRAERRQRRRRAGERANTPNRRKKTLVRPCCTHATVRATTILCRSWSSGQGDTPTHNRNLQYRPYGEWAGWLSPTRKTKRASRENKLASGDGGKQRLVFCLLTLFSSWCPAFPCRGPSGKPGTASCAGRPFAGCVGTRHRGGSS